MSLPIVFIHGGPCRHLAATLAQARQSSPDSEIFLLGDRFNAGLRPARHFQWADFFGSAGEFEAIYQHRSSMGVGYEKFCFQRWFILKEFMERQKLESCLYLDSDVLLFVDAAKEAPRFEAADVTPSLTSPHCMFINHRAGIDRFCAFVMECYSSPALFSQMESHYHALQAKNEPGGVCDMTVFGLYEKSGRGRTADLYAVHNGTAYDHAMSLTDGFEMKNGIKKIRFLDGQPHGTQKADGKLVRFHTLHFQGGAKRHLRAHLRLQSWRLKILYQWNRLVAERGKIREKLGRFENGVKISAPGTEVNSKPA